MEMNWNTGKSEQWNSRSGTVEADPGCVCINDYSARHSTLSGVCRIFNTAAERWWGVMVSRPPLWWWWWWGGVQMVCEQGKGNSHQSAHVIINTCISQLDRTSRWVIFLPKCMWKWIQTQSSLKAMAFRCVYSMSVVSHRWTIPLAADLLSWTWMPLRLRTEMIKCWGLPFLVFWHLQQMQVRDFEFDHLFLSWDQNLIPLIWVWFNSLYCFNLNKVTSGADAWMVWESVLRWSLCFEAFLLGGRGLCATRVAQRPDLPTWVEQESLFCLRGSQLSCLKRLSLTLTFLVLVFPSILWTDWLPGLIVCPELQVDWDRVGKNAVLHCVCV